MKYYIDIDGKTAGPFTLAQVKALFKKGHIGSSMLYATEESKEWMPLYLLLDLENEPEGKPLPTAAQAQPTIVINNSANNGCNNQGYPLYPMGNPRKSRIGYQILALFLGALGIHNFYAGRNGVGAIQCLLTIFTLGYAGLFMWLWAIIEIFVVTKDGNDIPMV